MAASRRACIGGPVLLVSSAAITGCSGMTDAATRIAYDIEAGVDQLGEDDGAKYTIRHDTPSKSGECEGPYKAQFDKVGALIVWCYDAGGQTVSSHSTSYHRRFVDTPRTAIVDKPARATLSIDLERRDGRAVIANVR